MALGVVAIVSVVASSVPAWRAARVEPVAALRNERQTLLGQPYNAARQRSV